MFKFLPQHACLKDEWFVSMAAPIMYFQCTDTGTSVITVSAEVQAGRPVGLKVLFELFRKIRREWTVTAAPATRRLALCCSCCHRQNVLGAEFRRHMFGKPRPVRRPKRTQVTRVDKWARYWRCVPITELPASGENGRRRSRRRARRSIWVERRAAPLQRSTSLWRLRLRLWNNWRTCCITDTDPRYLWIHARLHTVTSRGADTSHSIRRLCHLNSAACRANANVRLVLWRPGRTSIHSGTRLWKLHCASRQLWQSCRHLPGVAGRGRLRNERRNRWSEIRICNRQHLQKQPRIQVSEERN